jgi:hypothetical protein
VGGGKDQPFGHSIGFVGMTLLAHFAFSGGSCRGKSTSNG